ncbi:MAG TPA: hypothetical protein PKZ36_02540 [Candidatus Paceibacterota bacterium]|nr:hypothetical protein [Candidatus Paceibacterota bacterium]HPT18257.1 hypothetical protein [Candidatus Paceibacterota bacterium]
METTETGETKQPTGKEIADSTGEDFHINIDGTNDPPSEGGSDDLFNC